MSSVSGTNSGNPLDNQYAQSLIQDTGSTNGALNENQFIQLLESNPELAQGLAGAEGGDSSTTIDQLYQALSNGDGSISLTQLGNALGVMMGQIASGGLDASSSTSSGISAASGSGASSASGKDGSITIGDLTGDDAPAFVGDTNTATGTGSTSDLADTVSIMTQMLKNVQTQSYNQNGSASTMGTVTFFETTT